MEILVLNKYYSIYDCNEIKYKVLSIIEYKTNMGRGRNFRYTKNITNELIDENWIYPSLDSTDYIKTISICSPLISQYLGTSIHDIWRRERDSNPRNSFLFTRFPSVRLQPLGHLSINQVMFLKHL